MARPANDRLKVPSGVNVYIGTPTTSNGGAPSPTPAPTPSPTLTLSASGSAVAGAPFSVTLTAANLAGVLPSFPERVSGPALTFTPTSVSPAPGELVRLFGVVAAEFGTARIRAVAGSLVSNELSFPVSAAPAPALPAPTSTGQARNNRLRLFQPAAAETYPARVVGGAPYEADKLGPTNRYIDPVSGWPWANVGGDWIDANQAQQGATPWATFAVNSAPLSGDGAAHRYAAVAVTALAQFVHTSGKPFALRIATTGGPRRVAGLVTPGHLPPQVNVTYTDTTTAVLPCRLVADTSGSGLQPNTFFPSTTTPVFVEFDRPTKAVASATLDITFNGHFTAAATAQVMLLSPAVAVPPVTGADGLAAAGGPLDAGLLSVPGILGQHRYQDGSVLTDFVVPGGRTITDEAQFDPAIWGGTSNTALLPHAGLGKWINPPTAAGALELVNSSYTGHGFEPVAPGLGAIKLRMPAIATADGGVYPADSGAAANMMIFLPEPLFGVLPEIYVRFYFRLGTPYSLTPADRKQITAGGTVKWADMSGKWGITGGHATTYGGVSGTSGGGYGHANRLGWTDVEAGVGGPSEGGISISSHIIDDFQVNNPVGHRYGTQSDAGHMTNPEERWGQQGGHGGVLYAGRWYECETRIKLNTVNMTAGTWSADGILEGWVNGRLAFRKLNMVFRTPPLFAPAFEALSIRPCRDIGIAHLWLNWFHGGRTPNTVDRTVFYAALAYGTSRIGSLKQPALVAPSWVTSIAHGEVAELTVANGGVANTFRSESVDYYDPFYFAKIVNEFCGGTYAPNLGPRGGMVFWGGGHLSTNYNAAAAMLATDTGVAFRRLTNPSPIFGSTPAVAFANAGGNDGTNNGNFGAGARLNGATTQYTVDGQPGAPHTYNTGNIVSPADGGGPEGSYLRVTANYVGYNGPADVNAMVAFRLPLSSTAPKGSGTWQFLGAHPTLPTGTAIVDSHLRAPVFELYDRPSGRIFIESRNARQPNWYHVPSNTYVQGTGTARDQAGYQVDTGRAFTIESRRLALFLDRSSSGNLLIRHMDMSLAQPSWVNTPRTLSQAVPLMVQWTSACYCEHSNRILLIGAQGDTTGVYEIEVPANLGDTWTVTRVPFGAGQSIPQPLVASTYGRWDYWPSVRACVFLRQANQNPGGEPVFVYRPRFT